MPDLRTELPRQTRDIKDGQQYTDLTDTSYWAYPDIAEAANTHMAVVSDSGETWVD